MLGAGVRPNDRTYASLIDACARTGDKALALRVYRKAQREGCAAALEVYSAAVHACVQAAGGCDSEAAMAIYADMQRCGLELGSGWEARVAGQGNSRGMAKMRTACHGASWLPRHALFCS